MNLTSFVPRAFAVLALVPAAVACNDIESEDVMTSGVSPNYSLTVKDGATHVRANLSAGKGSLTFLELTGDDELVALQGDAEKKLSKLTDIDFNMPTYGADFDIVEPGTEFTLAFRRSVDDGAPKSTVKLPTAAAITAPASDASFSQADDDVVIEIDSATPEGETTTAEVSGECIQNASKTFTGDATSVTFEAGSLVRKEDDGEPVAADCALKVLVRRSTNGELDPAFTEGGTISAAQEDERQLQLKP